jgi:hypothetical protein
MRAVWSLLLLAITPAAHAQLPDIASVSFEQGFRVNGEPFFPILLYDAPTDDRSLQQFRDHGFNVLACSAKVCDELPAKGFYGAIHVGKKVESLKGVLLAIGTDSPALNYKKDLLKQTEESNAKVRAAAPGRPVMNAIGYWEDEPAGVFAGKLPAKEKYDDLIRRIDVAAPYLYPVPYQPIASVGEAVERARRATDGKKPLLPILQLFAWKADDRYPSPAELRAMAFLALLEGAHGIGYYSYGTVTGKPKMTLAEAEPELWKSVKPLNREIARTAPKLVAGKSSDAVQGKHVDGHVRLRVIADGDGALVVLVSSAPDQRDVQLALPRGGVLRTADGAILAQGDGKLSLLPFEVRILRWQSQ